MIAPVNQETWGQKERHPRSSERLGLRLTLPPTAEGDVPELLDNYIRESQSSGNPGFEAIRSALGLIRKHEVPSPLLLEILRVANDSPIGSPAREFARVLCDQFSDSTCPLFPHFQSVEDQYKRLSKA